MLPCVERGSPLSLADLAYTLQVGREAMESRLALVVGDLDELARGLKYYLDRGQQQKTADDGPPMPLFTGNLDEEGAALDLLLAGRLGEDLLRLLLAEHNLEKLASYWVKGGRIPWAALHHDGPFRLIALPTYPFARQHYWVQVDTADQPWAESQPRAGDVSPAGDVGERGPIPCDPAVIMPANSDFAMEPGRTMVDNLQRYLVWFLGQEAGLTPEQIKPGKGLRSYGVDSIASTKLMRGIEKYFQVRVTGRELLEHGTIESLVAYLAGKIDVIDARPHAVQPLPGGGIQARAEYRDAQVIEALEQLEQGALDLETVQRIIGN
jgi:acyl transferase domain-containing protein/acyl carrier protein